MEKMEPDVKKERISIVDPEGKKIDCEVIVSFVDDNTNKNYVVYTPIVKGMSDDEEISIFGALLSTDENGPKLLVPTEENDIAILKEVIDEFLKEEDN